MKGKEIVLSINNISKRYGHIQAVNNLSLKVEKGNVYGILGPNGSGKTTTLGIILDVVKADKGTYTWFGMPRSKENRKKIGAILDHSNFYPYLSAAKNLKIIADIKNVSYDNIEKLLKKVNLFERRNDKFKNYSLGMKQRLAIAAALLAEPQVLILDEPTNGLDPQGIAETRELIINIALKGVTIILASHLLDEVQKICTNVAILNHGKILSSGNVDEVLSDSLSVVIASDNIDKLFEVVNNYKNVQSISREHNKLLVKLYKDNDVAELNKYLISKGIILSHLSVRKQNLEKYFLKLLSQSD